MAAPVSAVHQGDREGTQPERAAITRTATGLLIPKLARAVPRSLDPNKGGDGSIEAVKEMAEAGLLKPTDHASSAYELANIGVDRLLGPVLREFESQHGEYVHVHRGQKEYSVSVFDCAVYNRITIKPVFTRIGMHSPAARWAAAVLNQHWGVSSPSNWLNVAGECGEFKLTLRAVGCTGNERDWEEADDATKKKYDAWEKSFEAEFPWLFHCNYGTDKAVKGFNATLSSERPSALRTIRRRDSKLADIFEALSLGLGKQPDLNNQEPYLTTQWTNSDPISHGWDYIDHQISEGNYDTSQNEMFAFGGSLAEIKTLFARADAWLQPVVALERWTYKHHA